MASLVDPKGEDNIAQVLIQGASRGIGLEFVQQLLASNNNGKLFATCREPESATALQSLKADHKERLQIIKLDVQEEASIEAAASLVGTQVSQLHLLINCAGILHHKDGLRPEKRLEDIKLSSLQTSFAVNAFGPVLMGKHFHPFFQHKRRSIFANISARIGSIGDNRLGGWYAYRSAKAAQNMFTKTMSLEFKRRAPHAICVALHPGTTDTDLSKPFQRNVPLHKLFSTQFAVAQMLRVIDALTPEQSGAFFAYDGTPIPW